MIRALATALALSAIGVSFAAAQSTAVGGARTTPPAVPAVTFVDRTSGPSVKETNLIFTVLFGTAGAGTDEVEGIVDPGNLVGIDIAKAYARTHRYAVSPKPFVMNTGSTPSKEWIVDAGSGPNPAAYVVDGGSPSISLHYSLRDASHYQVTYSSTVRIFASADGHAVATVACAVTPPPADTRGWAQVKANDGAVLKQMILATAKSCADQVRAQLQLGARGASEQDVFASPILNTYQIDSGVAAAAPDAGCSAERQAYAQRIGVDCRSLGERVSQIPSAPVEAR